jgi:hypothetical protein
MPSAPFLYDTAKDLALNDVVQNADRALYLNGDPNSYSDADTFVSNGGVKVGERNLSTIGFDGPVDGDTSGRKITLLKAGFVADESDSVNRVAIVDDDAQVIQQMFVVDDGAGNPVSTTEGFAYNSEDADMELRDANG